MVSSLLKPPKSWPNWCLSEEYLCYPVSIFIRTCCDSLELHDFNFQCKAFEIAFTEEIFGSVLLYPHQRPMLSRHVFRRGSLCRWKSTQAVTLRWADGTAAGAFLPKYLRENTLDPWCWEGGWQRAELCAVIADEQTFSFQAVNKVLRRPALLLLQTWNIQRCEYTESFALNSPNGVYYITFSRASPTRVEYPPMKGWVRSPSQGSLG